MISVKSNHARTLLAEVFFTRVTTENLLVTHDISSTTATFSSLGEM